jgi:ADP-ribose pyrophosphatase YjhB (NUDIX family)
MIVGEGHTDDPVAIRLAAYGLVRRASGGARGGEILLCRIASGYGEAGAWTLPGGGIEFGEAPEDAAVREIREETGLEVEIVGPPRILTDSGLTTAFGAPQRYHQVRFVYPVAVVGGEARVETGNSTDAFAWFGESELRTARLVDLVRLALELPIRE